MPPEQPVAEPPAAADEPVEQSQPDAIGVADPSDEPASDVPAIRALAEWIFNDAQQGDVGITREEIEITLAVLERPQFSRPPLLGSLELTEEELRWYVADEERGRALPAQRFHRLMQLDHLVTVEHHRNGRSYKSWPRRTAAIVLAIHEYRDGNV